MTELSGTLDGVGLPAIVRFLGGLQKTGCLRVSYADWQGEVFFDGGQVTGARLGSRSGLSALDALVQALPSGSFAFAAGVRGEGSATIHMSQEVFDAHLDELASRTAMGMPKLPPVNAVPSLVAEHDPARGDEPLALDRGTLQTLLAVNGQRTVREIVAQRGSFDALWQLRNLVEIGVVRLEVRASTVAAPEPRGEEPSVVRPFPLAAQPVAAASHCPKVGFEDDPSNTFGRPTRLHRCFASGTPQPLSLDQQRELCLSDHYGTCPRLTMPNMAPTTETEALVRTVADDPRIVRMPSAGRAAPAARHGAADATPGVARRRAPLHDVGSARSTPLRARMERHAQAPSSNPLMAEAPAPASTAPSPPPAPSRERRQVETEPVQKASPGKRLARRFRGMRQLTIGAAVVALLGLAVAGYLLAPKLAPLFADDAIDASRLPNTSAIAAGTPISQITSPRMTPPARVAAQRPGLTKVSSAADQTTTATNLTGGAAQPTPATNPTGAAASAAAAAASAAAARLQPTLAPTVAPTPAQPTPAPTPTSHTLLDEDFAASTLNWPNDPQRTAWLTSGNYQLATRDAGKFIAVSAPIGQTPSDVVVNATFRKVSGPLGGGYGIIVRDQGPLPQEGTRQDGRYYVLEVGDKGEVGIWRRESDHWVDVLPWQRSEAVKTDTAANELTVRAIGNSLSLFVNGTQVATRTDDALAFGSVGLFVGGDGNQVAVEHFVVQTP